tara:strand:- start:14716 stop:15462 length:747 start_codon:yes stop_codon:yes gene_type:complete
METNLYLQNKIFFVTGSQGLVGKDLCSRLTKAGSQVIACDIKNDNAVIKNYLKCDISSNSGLNYLEGFLNKYDNKINGFIHCAYPRPKSWGKYFEDITYDEINSHLQLQLGSTLILSRIFCKYLKRMGGGSLINISSIQGIAAPKFNHYEGTSMSSPIEYSCIKSSIIIMTKWLAKYYKNQNLNINCVSPGGIKDSQPEIFQKRYKYDCNNIGLLEPKNVSDVILFLLSDQAKGVNGQNFIIDDGWSL